ncbi:MAG: exodeoxyribonuclease VII small subunit [Clostridiales bacterium]|nr:exodeoxyribonuclease VII small subunit [Clostridiales bacterium]MDD7054254.1 exodeoxyribonuclease VII small subunit [Clostridiales bacterium]MDY5190559.1 exodeoxyribonuclease VII small subunit [Eubacteriales bacterium]
MNFETAYSKLEEIVKKLEGQNVSLEESIALFNSGIELSKECLKFLKESKGKIQLLTDELNNLCEEFKPE